MSFIIQVTQNTSDLREKNINILHSSSQVTTDFSIFAQPVTRQNYPHVLVGKDAIKFHFNLRDLRKF